MNFFQAQDGARRATRWLIIVYIVATLLIVAGVAAVAGIALSANGQAPDPELLLLVSGLALALILGATAYKTARLASGGGQVARDLGGSQVSPDSSDPLRRRLLNVVEEMSIASGIPVPEIYVLEQESGINAFAAGFGTADAAIAVTRGTLELLNRDELQGVIAHEFSHVLNGDMRLNIRMMGVLFGIMVIGLLGRLMLRGGYYGSVVSSRRGRSGNAALFIGLGLTLLGAIGVFFARIIKAAVSRQREYLADASAVQFTRQTSGIANALKKIAGYQQESLFRAADPEEVSHMLFARGARLTSLFATHPPLLDRIRALEPGFDADSLPAVEMPPTSPSAGDSSTRAAFAGGGAAAPAPDPAATIGNPTLQHVVYAGALRRGLPERLYSAAHAPGDAWLLALTLFVSPDPERAAPAFDLLEQQLGGQRTGLMRDFHAALRKGGPAWRLPLLEIAFPALRQTPRERLEYLLDLGERLIQLDNRLELHEFCLYRLLKLNIGQAQAPSQARRRPASRRETRRAGLELLAIVAERGNANEAAQRAAFRSGLAVFGDWAADAAFAPPADPVAAMGHALDTLQRVNNAARRSMVEAVAAAICADRELQVSEAELLRTICASLDCPLPPLSVNGPSATR